jgi:hypothetical protein
MHQDCLPTRQVHLTHNADRHLLPTHSTFIHSFNRPCAVPEGHPEQAPSLPKHATAVLLLLSCYWVCTQATPMVPCATHLAQPFNSSSLHHHCAQPQLAAVGAAAAEMLSMPWLLVMLAHPLPLYATARAASAAGVDHNQPSRPPHDLQHVACCAATRCACRAQAPLLSPLHDACKPCSVFSGRVAHTLGHLQAAHLVLGQMQQEHRTPTGAGCYPCPL